jgi:hypothetical protein
MQHSRPQNKDIFHHLLKNKIHFIILIIKQMTDYQIFTIHVFVEKIKFILS